MAVTSGEVVAVYGEPGHHHTLLALALGGRLVPSGGDPRIDADHDASTRQRQVALVDVPGVSEPDDVVPLTTIVGEELAMAGKPARRTHVDHWLTSNGLRAFCDDRVEDLPAGLRTVTMARLASLRPGVQFLVLALPERSGIDSGAWLSEATALAGAGFGVLATMSPATCSASVRTSAPCPSATPSSRTRTRDCPSRHAERAESLVGGHASGQRVCVSGTRTGTNAV